jgi:NTP pyrophosphatase (non-canonical NTP hydrolase)
MFCADRSIARTHITFAMCLHNYIRDSQSFPIGTCVSSFFHPQPPLTSFRGCNTQRESLCAWSSRWWSRTPARAVIAAFALEMGEVRKWIQNRAKLLKSNTESTQSQVGKLLQSYLSAMLSSHLALGHFLNNVMPPIIIHNDDKSSYGAFFPLRSILFRVFT